MRKPMSFLTALLLSTCLYPLTVDADMPGSDSCVGSITEDCHSRFKSPLEKQVDLNRDAYERLLRSGGPKPPNVNLYNTTNVGGINNNIKEQNNALTIGAYIHAQTGGGGDEINIKASQEVDRSALGTTLNTCSDTKSCDQSSGDSKVLSQGGGHNPH